MLASLPSSHVLSAKSFYFVERFHGGLQQARFAKSGPELQRSAKVLTEERKWRREASDDEQYEAQEEIDEQSNIILVER